MTNDAMIPGIYSLNTLQQAIAHAPDHWRPLVFTNAALTYCMQVMCDT